MHRIPVKSTDSNIVGHYDTAGSEPTLTIVDQLGALGGTDVDDTVIYCKGCS